MDIFTSQLFYHNHPHPLRPPPPPHHHLQGLGLLAVIPIPGLVKLVSFSLTLEEKSMVCTGQKVESASEMVST
jgi:hypothetical protein